MRAIQHDNMSWRCSVMSPGVVCLLVRYACARSMGLALQVPVACRGQLYLASSAPGVDPPLGYLAAQAQAER